MRTVAEAMAFIRTMTTVALGAVDKALLAQAIEILMEGAQEKGTDLNSNDPLAESLKAANAMAALLGVVSQGEPSLGGPPQTGGLGQRLAGSGGGGALAAEGFEVDLSQSLGTFINEQQAAAALAAGEDPAQVDEFGFPPLEDPVEDPVLQRPIGVPVDFVASVDVPLETGPSFFADIRSGRFDTPGTREVEPQYFEGDELAPATLDPAVIARLQRRLVAAGLLDDGTFYEGAWDDLTIAAYKSVLGFANQNGIDATRSMDRLIATLPQSVKDARARAKALEVFQEPPYIKPDMATLAQDVKRYFRQEVGRDPTASEMAEFSGAMSAAYRADFDAVQAAEEAAFNAANDPTLGGPSRTGGTIDQIAASISQPGGDVGTFQRVDPTARFREAFDRRFQSETTRLSGLDEVRANVNNVYASLRTMSSLIGGNR